MDIHKPKPWHSVREFLKEYVIIVVGVLTALAAEQTVEWLHGREEASHAREGLKAEISLGLANIARRQDIAPCVIHRTADLQEWLDSARHGSPLHPSAHIGRVASNGPQSQVWESVKASPSSAHLPVAERLKYAKLFSIFSIVDGGESREREAWLDLQEYEGDPPLDGQAQRRLQGLIARASFMNEAVVRAGSNAMAAAHEMGIEPAPVSIDVKRRAAIGIASLCDPLFGPSAH